MKFLLLLVFLFSSTIVFASEVLRPCCSKNFGNTERCLDLPRDICCLLNGTIPEQYKSNLCATDPCKKSCGDGIVDPWEDCDGGDNCSLKCRSEVGKCCVYAETNEEDFLNLTRDECTPIDVPMYWAKVNETCEEEEVPDRAYCRSSNTCCECGKNVKIMSKRDSVSSASEILIFIAIAVIAFFSGLMIGFLFWYVKLE